MSKDLYHFERTLENYLKRTDDKDIHEFAKALQAANYSLPRTLRYVITLVELEELIGKRLRDATRDDLERFVLSLKGKKPLTRDTELKMVKFFYRWLINGTLDRGSQYPPIVSWIKVGVKKSELEEPEILTEDEVKALIDKAPTTRDKALIAVLFDGGFRIGEILPRRVGEVEFDEMGAKIKVHGKTGSRVVRLIASAPLLARWIDEHPEKDNPNAWLWFSRKSGMLSYQMVRKILKETAERAGIRKRIYPHLFRHSSATSNARFLTEYELRVRYGWSSESDVPARYVHLSQRDLDEKLASVYSGRPVEPPKPKFAPIICPRCGAENTPGTRYCSKCGTPLTAEELAKSTVEIQELKEKVDQLTRILGSLAESLKKKR